MIFLIICTLYRRGVEILDHSNINLWFIRGIHEQLIAHQPDKSPGSFREFQNQIGGIPYHPSTADFIPPPVLQMNEGLGALENFIQEFKELAPLIKIALIHAQFETIHPFMDGNGRIGRLLITLQRYKEKIIDKPVLYLSYYFKKNKAAYNAHLQAIRDKGTWEEWLKFFFRGVIESSQNALNLAEKIMSLMKVSSEKIQTHYENGKTDSPQQLLVSLFSRPIVTGEDAISITKRSKGYCYEMLRTFEELGILVEYTGQQRNRRYIFKDYLDLLESIQS